MTTDGQHRPRRIVLAVAGAVVIVAVVAAAAFWFLRDDAPEAVSLDSASGEVADSDLSVDDLAGAWEVDVDTGTFDFEEATGSFVGFRVEEELSRIGSVTAVGRTGDVDGSIEITDGEGLALAAASFEVDMTTITTNDSRRDRAVQGALETGEFPTAQFELSQPVPLPDSATSGEPISAVAVGELTVHGVTRPVEFDLDARVAGSSLVVVGSAPVVFADYGVSPPSAPIVVSVEEQGTIEFQLLFVR